MRSRQGVRHFMKLMLALAVGCSQQAGQAPGVDGGTVTLQSELVTCNKTTCREPDGGLADGGGLTIHQAVESLGGWPGGVIYYKLVGADGWVTSIRKAMNDWENMTGEKGMTLRFQEAPQGLTSSASFPILTISDSGAGLPTCKGYDRCRAGHGNCDAVISNHAYHELMHCIGFIHTYERNESRHYTRRTAPTNNPEGCGFLEDRMVIPTLDNLADFGPYDYSSTMLSRLVHPDLTRWDGTPFVATDQCGQPNGGVPPPPCSSEFCQATCDAGICPTSQPMGFPSIGDASAVVEFYRNLSEPGWRKFLRTVNESTTDKDASGDLVPYKYDLTTTGTTIPAVSSPAVAFEPPNKTSIFVRGDNDRIYTKTRVGGYGSPWGDWTSLDRPGTGISGPAAVSWGAGRSDVVVRRGSDIHWKTFRNGAWGGWQSLGPPSSTVAAASAPAITSGGPNRLDVFVRDANNRLQWRKCSGTCTAPSHWSAWSQIGGTQTFRGKPAAVTDTSNNVIAFVHDLSGHVLSLTKNANDTWPSTWASVSNPGGLATNTLPDQVLKFDSNCPDCSSPAAGVRGSKLDVYVRGNDDKIWMGTASFGSPGFSSFTPLGGISTASPGSVTKGFSTDQAALAITMQEEFQRTSSGMTYGTGVWLKDYDVTRTYAPQLAVAANQDNRLEVVYSGVNDVLYSKWQKGTSQAELDTWTNSLLHSPTYRAQLIAMDRNQDGRLTAIYTGTDRLLRHATQWEPGAAFSIEQTQPLLNPTSTPAISMAVGVNKQNKLQVVYVGSDNTLRQTSQVMANGGPDGPGGPWDGERFLAESFAAGKQIFMTKRPDDGTDLAGTLVAVIIDLNDNLLVAQQDKVDSTKWTLKAVNTPSVKAKKVALATDKNNRLSMVFIGLDDVLFRTEEIAIGGNWTTAQFVDVAFTTGKEVALAENDNRQLQAIFVDANNHLQTVRQPLSGQGSWTGGLISSDSVDRLVAKKNALGQIEVVYVRSGTGAFARMRQASANSTNWTSTPF